MMKYCVLLCLTFLINSFQFSTSDREKNHYFPTQLQQKIQKFEGSYQNKFKQKVDEKQEHTSFKFKYSNNDENEVDPNDRVNITLWNQLNEEDMKRMPIIYDYSDEVTATRWLMWYLRIDERYYQIDADISWNFATNITEENEKILITQSLVRAPFSELTLPIAKQFNEHMKYSKNEDLRRIFGRLALGVSSNNTADVQRTSELQSRLENIYSTATVCETNNSSKCYTLAPYLERLMQIEKDYDRLTWAWKGWHDSCGNQVRSSYLSFADLVNKNVKENGYKDLSTLWIAEYEMGDIEEFEHTIDQILLDVMPLYEQLHAYVRGRLCEIYPNRFSCNGPIPAHILGNMWAQTWHDRFDDLIPYPDAPLVNITEALLQQNVSIHDMYTMAESFFTSIGLYPMTPKFWARSLFQKPTERAVACHASAYDMQYRDDFRVKVCTQIDEEYFYTIHHELGHIEYFMGYNEKQPYIYRNGANAGFHEAIGDTIGMFAVSPAHLIKLGFLDEKAVNSHYEINFLLHLALQKVPFMPFSYVMDKYRFLLFRGKIDPKINLNTMWWALRIAHGGVMPAVPRNDEDNFDAGAKYHIPSNVPYLRYYIAHILQFQFYRSMCHLQGVTQRLYMCDIYGNKNVGKTFKEMLTMGNSKTWPEILKSLTGETKLDSRAMLDFFEPLYEWLKKENFARNYPIGWM